MNPRLWAFIFAMILGALTTQTIFWRSVLAHLDEEDQTP